MVKNEKGITLIALVITIIIMLILSGVVVALIVDEEGIFSKTKEIAGIYNESIDNESEKIQDLLNMMDIEPPTVPTVEWRYKSGVYSSDNFINHLSNIDTFFGRDEGGSSYLECTTKSDNPEIEILNINGIIDITSIRFSITYMSDDINYKIYYTENEEYEENNYVIGMISKEGSGKTVNIPKGNYKKIKIILGDRAGLIYRFGTIDLIASASGVSGKIIRNNLKSTDNIGVKKYQYSENKMDWYDCGNEVTYNSDIWNKTYYYRAVDWAGNVSEPTEACVINIDYEKPTVKLEISNVTSNSFVLKAEGNDAKSGMYRYDFYVDGVLEEIVQSTENEVTYEVNNKSSSSNYKCKVIAYDLVGNKETSQEISVTTL